MDLHLADTSAKRKEKRLYMLGGAALVGVSLLAAIASPHFPSIERIVRTEFEAFSKRTQTSNLPAGRTFTHDGKKYMEINDDSYGVVRFELVNASSQGKLKLEEPENLYRAIVNANKGCNPDYTPLRQGMLTGSYTVADLAVKATLIANNLPPLSTSPAIQYKDALTHALTKGLSVLPKYPSYLC